MSQPGLLDVGLIVAREFDRLGVAFLVGGSVASGLHGEPRLTQDVHLAAVLREGDAELVPVTSAEDIVLQKLLWYRKSEGSLERQLRDVAGVWKLQRERLDLSYLRAWARELELAELLGTQCRQAGLA